MKGKTEMKITLTQWTVLMATLRNSLDYDGTEFTYSKEFRKSVFNKICHETDNTNLMFRTRLIPTSEITEEKPQ